MRILLAVLIGIDDTQIAVGHGVAGTQFYELFQQYLCLLRLAHLHLRIG